MNGSTFFDAYYSDLQSLYALLIAPSLFLLWRLTRSANEDRALVPSAARFVAGLTLFFAVATIVDPIATGPLLKLDVFRDQVAATLVPFFFVLLGDLRVLLLAIGVARPDRTLRQNLIRAFGLSLLVPVFAGFGFALAGWIWPGVHGQILWMLYEFGFLLLCILLLRFWLPGHLSSRPSAVAFLRSILRYSAAYYALGLSADWLIGGFEMDAGWALRMMTRIINR